ANITAIIPIARRNSPISITPRGKVGEVPSTPALRALVRPLLAFAASRVVFPRDYGEGELRCDLVTEAPFSATLHASSRYGPVLLRCSRWSMSGRYVSSASIPMDL